MKDEGKLGWEGLQNAKTNEAKQEAPSVKKWEALFNERNKE